MFATIGVEPTRDGRAAEMARKIQNGTNRGDNATARRSANTEVLAQRRVQAMQWRLEGVTLVEIGRRLGISHVTVWHDVKLMLSEYMKTHEAETIPQLRAQELQRIDTGLVEVYKILASKSGTELALKAVDRLARLINLRSELLGLKVPIEANLKITQVSQLDREYEELILAAEAHAAQQRIAILEGTAVEDGGPVEVA